MEYTFKKCDEDRMAGTAQICGIYEFGDGPDDFMSNYALAYGQLKTRFGEPMYTSKDLECLYNYCLIASDEDGNELVLTAYCGPTGPAIGGNPGDEKAVMAAKQLAEYICEAGPTDCKISGYYYDSELPLKITLGVKNGKPYMKGGLSILRLFGMIGTYIKFFIRH
ncbi:MAG: hypothetical protein J5959_13110 [Butyrivibrio sp.]|nr:hypothetical protein [Butyrivibrio sp.]